MNKGRQPFFDNNCTVNDCFLVSKADSRSTPFEFYDAVLFHLPDLLTWSRSAAEELNAKRQPHQRSQKSSRSKDAHGFIYVCSHAVLLFLSAPRFVAFDVESPPMTPREGMGHSDNFYNWTMTYRRDSDIFSPYGAVLLNEGTGIPPKFDRDKQKSSKAV